MNIALNQQNKHIVWDFWQALDNAPDAQSIDLAHQAMSKVIGKQRLFCEMTLKGGAVAWDWNGRMGVDFKTLGPTYGIRPGVDRILPPEVKK